MTRQQRHFTLVEILVVMVIISIILGLTFPAFFRLTHSTAVDNAGRMVAAQLSLARAEAIAKRRHVAVIMPGTNWLNDTTEPQPYRFSSFRAAYVSGTSSPYNFDEWVPGTSWTFLPQGAIIAQCDASAYSSSTDELQSVAGSPDEYTTTGSCPVRDSDRPPVSTVQNGTSHTMSIVQAGNGASSTVPNGSEVRAIVFNPNGSASGETFVTLMGGIVPQGASTPTNMQVGNLYVLHINQFTGKAKMLFPPRRP
jgi:prepilin-type N-terminal cleavage/methylation domain-containing protein